MAVCSNEGRAPAGNCALAVSACPGRNLLFRFLFPRVPDPRIDWPTRNFTRGLLPSGYCPLARTVGAGVVRANAALVFERVRDADWTVLGRNDRVGTVNSQPVATGNAGDLFSLFFVFCECGTGFLGLSVRRHAAGSWIHFVVLRAARTAARIGTCESGIARQSFPPAMGMVSDLFRIGDGEDPGWRSGVAQLYGDG